MFKLLVLLLVSNLYAKPYPWSGVTVGMYNEEPEHLSGNIHQEWTKHPYSIRDWDEDRRRYKFTPATQEQRAIYNLFALPTNIHRELHIWTHPQLKNKWLTRGRGDGDGWDETWVVKRGDKYIVVPEDKEEKYGLKPEWKGVCVCDGKEFWKDYLALPTYVTRTVETKEWQWQHVPLRKAASTDDDSFLKEIPDDARKVFADRGDVYFQTLVTIKKQVVEEQ